MTTTTTAATAQRLTTTTPPSSTTAPTMAERASFADHARADRLRPHAIKAASTARGWRIVGRPSPLWPHYYAAPGSWGDRDTLKRSWAAWCGDAVAVVVTDHAADAQRDDDDRRDAATAHALATPTIAALDLAAQRDRQRRADLAAAPTFADLARESTTAPASPLAALRTPRPTTPPAPYVAGDRFAALDLDALDAADLDTLAPRAALDADAQRMAERFGRLDLDHTDDGMGDALDRLDGEAERLDTLDRDTPFPATWSRVRGVDGWGVKVEHHADEIAPHAGDRVRVVTRKGIVSFQRLARWVSDHIGGSRWAVAETTDR